MGYDVRVFGAQFDILVAIIAVHVSILVLNNSRLVVMVVVSGFLALAEPQGCNEGGHHEDTGGNDANQDAQGGSELEIGEASTASSLHLGRQQSNDGLLSGLDEDRFADAMSVDGRYLEQRTHRRDDGDASEKDADHSTGCVAMPSRRLIAAVVSGIVDDDTVRRRSPTMRPRCFISSPRCGSRTGDGSGRAQMESESR